jgi:hypothetical protein
MAALCASHSFFLRVLCLAITSINFKYIPSQKFDDRICEGRALICTIFCAEEIKTQMQMRS